MIFTNIIAGGFAGKIFPVNPRETSLFGLPVYKRISDIPEPVDVAFITIPAGGIPAILEECGRKAVKGVVLITSGFSEAGSEGAALEREIAWICKRLNIVLIGPNTIPRECRKCTGTDIGLFPLLQPTEEPFILRPIRFIPSRFKG